MRKWVFDSFGSEDNLRLTESEVEPPGPLDAEVRLTAVGVNPVDRSTISGRFDWIPRPHTPGAEGVGVVTRVGEQVNSVKKGERVALYPQLFCGRCRYCMAGEESACLSNTHIDSAPGVIGVASQGCWSETMVIPAQNLVPIPSGLDDAQAAGLPVDGMTAYHLLERSGARTGETVLVMGAAGGVGVYSVQFAKLRGCHVVAVCSTVEQEQKLYSLGVDRVVRRDRSDVAAEVCSATRGLGADVVLDPLGATTWQTSVACLSPLGRYVTCGILTGAKVELNILGLYSKQNAIIGSTVGSRRHLSEVVNLAAAGKIRTMIDSSFSFENIPAALKRLGVHGRTGKVLASLAA